MRSVEEERACCVRSFTLGRAFVAAMPAGGRVPKFAATSPREGTNVSPMWRVWLLTLLITGWSFIAGDAQTETPRPIEPSEQRADTRAALLQRTPVGTSLAEVLKFLATNLHKEGDQAATVEPHGATGEAAAHGKTAGVKSIRMPLGQYVENPATIFLTAPMLLEREVTAQWAFDEHDRLVDIFVDKTTATY
ncbi:MAG: hypothetical protein M3Y80_04680 [Verrucomicrobiota bacterium]|nr:hypothetical protein [Verrucomicrobiota bacterium]